MKSNNLQLQTNQEQKRLSLMVQIATLYYEDNLTQAEIAKQLGLTRLRVNKLLQAARAEGVVNIEIRDIVTISVELATKLERKFSLQKVVVVPTVNSKSEMVANYLG